ncbi:MAG: hypothetical protein ACSHXB_19290 [Sulfitobacter sp.]
MTRSRGHAPTTFQINMYLLGAVAYGVGAYLIWPDSLKWWGFGLLSILLGMAAPAFLIKAVTLMVKRRNRDVELDAIERLGSAPKSAHLATDGDLENLGVFQAQGGFK